MMVAGSAARMRDNLRPPIFDLHDRIVKTVDEFICDAPQERPGERSRADKLSQPRTTQGVTSFTHNAPGHQVYLQPHSAEEADANKRCWTTSN